MVSYVVSTCKQVDVKQSMQGDYSPTFIHEHEATVLLSKSWYCSYLLVDTAHIPVELYLFAYSPIFFTPVRLFSSGFKAKYLAYQIHDPVP